MKRIYINIGLILVTLLSMISCVEDNSDIGTKALSYLSVIEESKLDTLYRRDKGLILNLTAPEIKQASTEKELSYEWQVDYEVLSTSQTLDYVCKRLGLHDALLKVSNEDHTYYFNFKIQVDAAYQKGVLLLTESNGASKVHFKRTDKENVPLFKDVYAVNNPTISLGKEPVTLLYTYMNKGHGVYILTNNPSKLVRIDSKTFEVIRIADYPGKRMGGVTGFPYFNALCISGGGELYDYDMQSNVFLNATQKRLPEKSVIADNLAFSYNVKVYQIGNIFFDTNKQQLWLSVDFKMPPYKISGEEFKGKDLVYMGICNNIGSDEILLITEDKKTKEKAIVRYLPIGFPSFYGGKPPYYRIEANNVVPKDKFNENSTFIIQRTNSVMYYSVDNYVYNYNYLGNSYAESPVFKFSQGEKVVAMQFDEVEKQIYIATNLGIKGNLYCYDLQKKEMLWKEEEIEGQIVSMIFKGEY